MIDREGKKKTTRDIAFLARPVRSGESEWGEVKKKGWLEVRKEVDQPAYARRYGGQKKKPHRLGCGFQSAVAKAMADKIKIGNVPIAIGPDNHRGPIRRGGQYHQRWWAYSPRRDLFAVANRNGKR